MKREERVNQIISEMKQKVEACEIGSTTDYEFTISTKDYDSEKFWDLLHSKLTENKLLWLAQEGRKIPHTNLYWYYGLVKKRELL